jgi:hypothetical protein
MLKVTICPYYNKFRILTVAIFKMMAVATPTTCHQAAKYFLVLLNLVYHMHITILPPPHRGVGSIQRSKMCGCEIDLNCGQDESEECFVYFIALQCIVCISIYNSHRCLSCRYAVLRNAVPTTLQGCNALWNWWYTALLAYRFCRQPTM